MGARILVVEDNPTNLQLMMYLLKAFGHEAVAASDGLRGMEAVGRERFDLVLCDVLMPGIDGFEFARRYKAIPNLAPLIAVTALAMVGDRERLLEAGFDGYISKPIDPETFVSSIEPYLPESMRDTADRSSVTTACPVVLTIDDVQVNRDLVRSSLQPFGYEIVEADSVSDGLEKAKSHKPSVILCDLHMIGGDGFDMLRQVKELPELGEVPFFFLTSTGWGTSERIRGMQLGARKFLVRPIDPGALRREIEMALAGS